MKFFILLLSALFLLSCEKSNQVTPVASPSPSVSSYPSDIDTIVINSACYKYNWKNRGQATYGYIKGMALTYARSVCEGVADFTNGPTSKDALAYYGQSATVKNTYALLIGLGMRESSGKYCEGRDMTAKNVTADTAEAGLFQTSYDSHTASPVLDQIFSQFKKGDRKCFLDVFKEGFTCSASNLQNYGTGEGMNFQKLSKECPSFAVEYASLNIRVLRNHYGPLNRKEAEFRPECVDMLGKVEQLIKSNSGLCQSL